MAMILAAILRILTFAALSWQVLPVAGESLVKAVEDGNFQQVKHLVEGGEEIDAATVIENNTALMMAVSLGRSAIASYLLDKGADIDRQNNQGMTALMFAALGRRLELGLELVSLGAKLDLQTDGGLTALMLAAYTDTVELGIELVSRGANLELLERRGWTALMFAAAGGTKPELGISLVQHGASLDHRATADGLTALILAVGHNHSELALEMLRCNASVNLQSNEGITALMSAPEANATELGIELLCRGARFDLEAYNDGSTALLNCAEFGDAVLAAAILEHGSEVDTFKPDGETPLMAAAKHCQLKVVKVLLDHGANIMYTNGQGLTPYQLANNFNCENVASYLEHRCPSFWEQVRTVFGSPKLWFCLGCGACIGFIAAVVAVVVALPREHADSVQDSSRSSSRGSRRSGAQHLAFVSLAKSRHGVWVYAYIGRRALGVVGSVLFPFGLGMLLIAPSRFAVLYVLIYVLPVVFHVGLRTVGQDPCILLVGSASRGGWVGWKDPRIPRLIVTIVLLALTLLFQFECHDVILFFLEGNMGVTVNSFVAGSLIDLGSMNPRGAFLVCAEKNPMAQSIKVPFLIYLALLWVAAAVWVMITSCELVGLISPVRDVGSEEDFQACVEKILEKETADEIRAIDSLPVEVAPEGLFYVAGTIFLFVADAALLDCLLIFNFAIAYHFRFAGALTCVVVLSTCLQIRSGGLCRLCHDGASWLKKGIQPDSLMQLLHHEKGVEAPLSLALTAYAFCFSVSNPFSLASSLASLALSLHGVAQYIYQQEDLYTLVEGDLEDILRGSHREDWTTRLEQSAERAHGTSSVRLMGCVEASF